MKLRDWLVELTEIVEQVFIIVKVGSEDTRMLPLTIYFLL